MFSGKTIAVGFLMMFGSIGLVVLCDKLKQRWLEPIAVSIGLVAGLYCLTAGVFLWGDWQDPFVSSDITSEELGRAAGSHGGRGGIVLLAIRYWPYVLGALGAYFTYQNAWLLSYHLRSATRRR